MNSSALLEKLSSLKLSDGARVSGKAHRPSPGTATTTTLVSGGANVSSVLERLGGKWSPVVSPSVYNGPLQGLVIGSDGGARNNNNNNRSVKNDSRGNDKPIESATSHRAGGEAAGVKVARKPRASPKSQQPPDEAREKTSFTAVPRSVAAAAAVSATATVASAGGLAEQPSASAEALMRAAPCANVASAPSPQGRAAPTPSVPMVVSTSDGGPDTVRLATVCSGDPSSPKRLEPIDNFNSSKPIIRSVPPCKHRYIIVGDIHGCPEQLEELLMKVNFQHGKDCLIHVGDLVNKGPDSLAVVRLMQAKGALGVLGNHDFTLLNCIARVRGKPPSPRDEPDPVMRLATSFPRGCEDYLRSLPHILRIPQYNVIVVHAGLNVDLPLDKQNVHEIMHLRRLERSTEGNGNGKRQQRGDKQKLRAVVKGPRGQPWGELWTGPECVVFGHDARAGLQELPFAYGIDTGCVYGKQLTAVVFAHDSPKGKLVSVTGLPTDANERRGLPPPAADVYEKYAEELERLILRPTPRATSAIAAGGQKPTFLSAPPAGSPALLGAGGIVNPSMRPDSCCSLPAAPPSPSKRAASRGGEVEKETILALLDAGEVRAVGTLMRLPAYESMWTNQLCSDFEGTVEGFWTPFVKGALAGLLASGGGSARNNDYVEDLVQLVLEACDEFSSVREMAIPQLHQLLRRVEEGAFALPKAVVKMLKLIAGPQSA